MARDGSGNYSRIHNWVTDLGNSIPVTASRMDAEMDSEATALTNSLDRSASGGGDILRDVGMSNHKFTSMSDGSALTDSINYKQVQNGEILFFGTTAGTSTVYTLAPSPSIDALDTGMWFWFKVDEDCGASPTLNISAKGAKNMKKFDEVAGSKVAIEALDLQTSVFYLGYYDGTDVIVFNPAILQHLQNNKQLFKIQTDTIASGTFAYSGVYSNVAGEGDVADTLASISGGSAGNIIFLVGNKAYDITITHNGSVINLANDLDVKLKNGDVLGLLNIGSNIWLEIFRSLANSFRTGSGYYYLPNNVLVQWGSASTTFNTDITFPIAYDSAPHVVSCSGQSGPYSTQVSAITTTKFRSTAYDATPSGVNIVISWRATGTKAQ